MALEMKTAHHSSPWVQDKMLRMGYCDNGLWIIILHYAICSSIENSIKNSIVCVICFLTFEVDLWIVFYFLGVWLGNASTTTTVIDNKNGSVPKSPGKVLKRTVTEDIVTTFSSPAAWLLVIALIITWSAVAIVMFDLVDYKNFSGKKHCIWTLNQRKNVLLMCGIVSLQLNVVWKIKHTLMSWASLESVFFLLPFLVYFVHWFENAINVLIFKASSRLNAATS